MNINLEMLSACPVCGCKDVPIAYASDRENYHMTHSFCADCHLIFLNPRMTDEQTSEYYAGMYRDTIDKNVNGISDVDIQRQQARAFIQTDILKEKAQGCKSNLEIGSSMGYLMAGLHEAIGIECVGIEADERYHKIDPACNFEQHTDISELEAGRRFDLITMSHSLEHFNHPLDYINMLIEKHAHKDTLFMIEVPNTEYYQCFGIAHPMNFTPETLNDLFRRAKCDTVANITHGLGTRLVFRYLVGIYKVR